MHPSQVDERANDLLDAVWVLEQHSAAPALLPVRPLDSPPSAAIFHLA
jgi:hypothetical protein